MSHFAVAVFSDDCDFKRLLAPYNSCDENYFVFFPVEYDELMGQFNKFKKHNQRWTFEMYINEFGYVQDENGQWGEMHNPNGRWDFYTLDGKLYLFDLKTDAKLEAGKKYYRKNDYEWFKNDEYAIEDAREFWDDFIGDTAIAEPPGPWNKQYFLNRYKTKEQYTKEASRTIPYAFITPDGVWHAAGRVLYFGMSDETAEDADMYAEEWENWINSNANPYVSIVDCHI